MLTRYYREIIKVCVFKTNHPSRLRRATLFQKRVMFCRRVYFTHRRGGYYPPVVIKLSLRADNIRPYCEDSDVTMCYETLKQRCEGIDYRGEEVYYGCVNIFEEHKEREGVGCG